MAKGSHCNSLYDQSCPPYLWLRSGIRFAQATTEVSGQFCAEELT